MTVQFVEGHFVESYYPTIENTFSKLIKHGNAEFATEIVDTAGQVSANSAFSPLVCLHIITCIVVVSMLRDHVGNLLSLG